MFDQYKSDKRLTRSLWMIIVGVSCSNVYGQLGGTPLTGLSKDLGASDFMLGLLMALPVFGNLTQLLFSYVLERTCKRKSIFLFFGVLQRVLWLPVGLVPFFMPDAPMLAKMWIIILLVTFAACNGSAVNVCYNSWLADLVPPTIRGRYFGLRNRIIVIAGVLANLLMSWLMDILPGLTCYAVVFAIGSVFGVMDILSYIWVYDPPMKKVEQKQGMLSMMGGAFKNKDFMRLVVFWTLWSFSVNIAGPYFNVYMLNVIGMNFMEISLTCTVVSSVCTFLFISKWGWQVDRYGTKAILRVVGVLCSCLPFLWWFTGPRNFWIMPIIQGITGAFWCAIDLCSQTQLVSNTPDKNRSMYIALYAILTSLIGASLAYAVGGALLDTFAGWMQGLSWSFLGQPVTQYHLIFTLTGLLRLVCMVVILPTIRDEKDLKAKDVISGIYTETRDTLRTKWRMRRRFYVPVDRIKYRLTHWRRR